MTLRKQRSRILDEVKTQCRGKSVLICGAGPSLQQLESLAGKYDVVIGVNGLSRYYYESDIFTYFFIEDYEAYLNYRGQFDENKVILSAGMPGHRHRQIPFIHFYGFPRFLSQPFFSRTGRIFFWAGSVIPFAINVVALSAPRSIDVLGFDLSYEGHFADEYRNKCDLVNPTDWDLQRQGALKVFSSVRNIGIPIRSIGKFKWP